MDNLNSKDTCELNKSKPRRIQKFEKRPPLKVSNKAQASEKRTSTFEDKVTKVFTPVVEVTHRKNDVHYEKNLFKDESNLHIDLSKINLSSAQNKYESLSGQNLNGSNANYMPANRRLSSLRDRLNQWQVTTSNKESQQGLISQNKFSSTNKIENNEKSSLLNNKLSREASAINGGSSQTNGSQDKNRMWSLSSTIWSPDVQVKSKEMSCTLSLEGTLILTNMYTGSLCSTKEYSKPTLLKTLSLVEDKDWELSKKIWSADRVSLQDNRLKESEKLTQFTQRAENEYESNSTTIPEKKSRMSVLLERLRSQAHIDQSSPADSSKPSPSKAASGSSPLSSPPQKSKSPSSVTSLPTKAASVSSRSPGGRPRGSCYNCGQDDHTHYNCRQPVTQKFCHKCGWEGVDSAACPFCTGTLVRPGSNRPVRVGGDARKKYDSVDIDAIREETRMIQERKMSRGQLSR